MYKLWDMHCIKLLFLAKASVAFGRLHKDVWERKRLSLHTILKVYNAFVLPILMYACETRTVYSSRATKLNRFHLNCLHRLLHITWQDKVPDTEVLNHTELPRASTLSWAEPIVWSCCQNGRASSQTSILQRADYGDVVCWQTAQALQGHPQSLLERHQSRVMGGSCCWEMYLAQPRQGGCHLLWKEQGQPSREEEGAPQVWGHQRFNTRFSPWLLNLQQNFPCKIGLISHSRTHRPQSLDQWVMSWLINNIVPLRGRYSINNTFLRNKKLLTCWSCCQNGWRASSQTSILQRADCGDVVCWRTAQALQGHPQSLLERL